jgi:hypothetical protein
MATATDAYHTLLLIEEELRAKYNKLSERDCDSEEGERLKKAYELAYERTVEARNLLNRVIVTDDERLLLERYRRSSPEAQRAALASLAVSLDGYLQ